MLRPALLWISENRWCRESMPRYGFVRRAVRRFMPGETLDDALEAAETLERGTGIPTLVTFLGENVTRPAEAQAVADHYVEAAGVIAARGLDAEISLKPTHLGLDLGPEVAEQNVRNVAKAAADFGNRVWLDMEQSGYVDATLDLYRAVRAAHDNFGICLQAYLHRTPADLESLASVGPAVRLVKGAYAEPPETAIDQKSAVDQAFFDLATRMLAPEALRAGMRAAFATHDAALIRRIEAWAASHGVDPRSYEYQMLYGIGREEQNRLASKGRKVRVLISYGDQWFPWYVRRLAERPANVGFVVRSMFRR